MRLVPSPTSRLLITTLVTGLAASVQLSSPARADGPSAPGSFTGQGFDACVAPSQEVMDAWNTASPFSAIGIYISGSSRYCGDDKQPNLSASWVSTNAARGWRFIPIHVGRQAPCFKNNPKSRVQKKVMSSTVSTARSQAQAEAQETIAALKKYGFGAGSYTYLDIEAYKRTAACDTIVLEFTDAWTEYLHTQGYRSGLYSSGSAAIAAVDAARKAGRPGFTLPDQMWIAWTNKLANTDGGPYLAADGWVNHQRIHQYHNGVDVTYGGKTLNIDKNFLDVGKGSLGSKPSTPCGVTTTFASYPTLRHGSKGAEVAALECLLKKQGLMKSVNTSFGQGTVSAVNAFRSSRGWSANGKATRPVWTALLSRGTTSKVIKEGAVGSAVWRLQRSLTATGLRPGLTGVYDAGTVQAVAAYRKACGLKSYPTTEATVWAELQRGKTI